MGVEIYIIIALFQDKNKAKMISNEMDMIEGSGLIDFVSFAISRS